jgi:predicted SprT family Zn-dependent metalloprotease
MNLRIGDTVLFGPPGEAKAKGVIVRLGAKTRIRQLGAAHGQPEGTEWNVPSTSAYITVITPAFGGAAGRGSVPVSKGGRYHPPEPKPRRSSRPPPPPRRSSRPPPPPRSTASPARPGHAPPSGDLSSHRETIAFAHDLLRQWAIPNYKVMFSNRFTRRIGQCNFRAREIGYSAPLWPLATAEQRRQTTIHEVAHAVTRDRHGAVAAHGKEWKAQMVAMGVPPKRTHDVNRESIRRTRGDTVAMTCCGNAPFRVMLKKAHALVTLGGRCRACQQAPVFASAADRTAYNTWLYVDTPLRIRPNSCLCGAHSLECGLVSR